MAHACLWVIYTFSFHAYHMSYHLQLYTAELGNSLVGSEMHISVINTSTYTYHPLA